jgi:hypothetical protein
MRVGIHPSTPGMIDMRSFAQRLDHLRKLFSRLHRERRCHTDVMQHARVVIEAQQQGANQPGGAFVPAKAADHTVCGPNVLDLQHDPFAGRIRQLGAFRNDAIQTRAFESLEPRDSKLSLARHGGQMYWRSRNRGISSRWTRRSTWDNAIRFFPAAARMSKPTNAAGVSLRELRYSRRGGMQSKLERVEIQAIGSSDHDFAVDDAASRQRIQQLRVELGKIPIQWLKVATLDVDIGAAAENDRPKAVPLRFEQIFAGLGNLLRVLWRAWV